ncbi:MAG TPA: DoxX family membrane protein [Polyangiaceae bacterium]
MRDSTALSVLRILTGLLVFSHGLRKLLKGPVASIGKSMADHGFPESFAYVITLGELAGLLLALGLYTRYAAGIVALTLAGIVVVVQRGLIGQIGTGRGVPLEYPLLLLVLAALFVVVPARRWSLGRR